MSTVGATVSAVGKRTDLMAAHLAHEVVKPLVASAPRLAFALDDTPTERPGFRPRVRGLPSVRQRPRLRTILRRETQPLALAWTSALLYASHPQPVNGY